MNKLVSSPGTIRPMLGLAMPVLAEESLTMLVGYTDWWLAGHFLVGPEFKAAMGLMSYILWLLPSMFAAVAIGATALIARFIGAGDREAARRVTHQALLMGSAITLFVLAAVLLGGRSLVEAMQLDGRAADLTVRYIGLLTPVIPAIMIEQVGVACLRGAGDTVSGFVAKSIVNLVNVVVSTLLVIGPGGIPKLGWEGLAIGTACGHALGGFLVLALLIRGRAGMRLALAEMGPDWELIRRLWSIGMPGGVDVVGVLACHFVYLAIINSLGVDAAAAHGLGVQIEAMAYLPCYAFHVAASTMTGQLLGAGDPQRAERGAKQACYLGTSLLTAAALVFYFAGTWLAGFFTGDVDDPTALAAGKLLKIVAISTPPLAVVMVLTGALRGAGDTRWPLVATFLGLTAVRLPLACLFAWETISIPGIDVVVSGLSLGVAGAWWAMVIDVVLRSLLLVYRFWRGNWKAMSV
ncbi:MAG: MATE family efflux transporter [Planctomycetaceae bacterium]|nr:MATE family efflux transporter [Planctomycetales bacterium]MCB9926608.1 MATE family efflux transporter [Planctomycetaceae bacterium]